VPASRLANTVRLVALLLSLGALTACGGSRRPDVLVDPAVSLAPHSRIGLVTFTATGARGGLATLATSRMAERVLGAQQGIEVLELGTITGPIDAAAARRLGAQHGVKTIMVGQLTISDLKPKASLLGGISLSTEVTLALSTRLLSTESGATLWARSSTRRETLQSVSIANGTAVVDAQDPKEAYGEVVNALVWNVTTDLRGTGCGSSEPVGARRETPGRARFSSRSRIRSARHRPRA
jgi:hypothetical protein